MNTTTRVRSDDARYRGRITARIAAIVAFILAIVGIVAVPTMALAATGDYTVSLDAPDSVQIGRSYNYSATLQFDGVDSGNPSTGVVLTTVLPEGTTFESVPVGVDSPVESYTYDAATRTLSLVLKDATQPLLTIVYTVRPVNDEFKHEGTTLTTSISGTGGPSGPVESNDVTTAVTGDNGYSAGKGAEVIAGGDNRTVTYRFNIGTTNAHAGTTFTSWAQTLTDSFPAGTELVRVSAPYQGGSWDTSAWPDATWTREGQYSPSGYNLDTSGQRIWLTVRYPETVTGWEDGQRPPENTVELETSDHAGVSHDGRPASVQGPEFISGTDTDVAATKVDSGPMTTGFLSHTTQTAGSYIGPSNAPDLDELVLTDSGADGSPNASWFSHADILGLRVTFSSGLAADDLPVRLEYQIDGSSTWQELDAPDARTSEVLGVAVQRTGSSGWVSGNVNAIIDLPIGSTLTGWRVTVAPGAETVAVGSEVRVRMAFQPVFRTVDAGVQPVNAPAATSPGPQTNTVTVSGGTLQSTASSTVTPADSVYVTTNIAAPGALSVGGPSGNLIAGIVNQNPSETYSDSELRVVLPCGLVYDPAQAITPVNPTATGVAPTPAIGAGATVDTTGRVTDADGCEQQVVRFSFDQLPPMRPPGIANDRWVEGSGWRYRIPVIALAQAYDPADTSVPSYSYATVADPRFLSVADGGTNATTVPMTGYGPFFDDDTHDFDPARTRIAVATGRTTVNTAGGLLISKLSSDSATGPWALTTEVGAASFWQIHVNDVLPNPVSNTVFFDKLPSIADGDDFDTQLAGPVTGVPAGMTVEYSTDARSATTGTWTADPAGATAFRIAAGTLTTGSGFTIVVPTQNLGDFSYGQRATNAVSATGVYGDAPVSFSSNEAAITVLPAPELSLVKKTNGVEYDAAPGAIVAVGSTVTWTYEVTNTGDTALDDVTVADAFTDGAGATGDLAPVSTESGPLQPGATRTFVATGPAVGGQYRNTATASATAVDGQGEALPEQPVDAVDDSWYFAGNAGLSIVKTTNGEHVTSAPGLWLTPGDAVEWSYTVTNTGQLPLTDVAVTDVDAEGTLVFDDVIANLAPGESVTLTAEGTAIVGQYRNTVTARAENPAGGDPLTGADDSWYFGIESGVEIDKAVSATADGPWTEEVEVSIGDATYWQIIVTNTGNTPLTDVVVTDAKLGETIEVGDLAVGESKTIVLSLDHTTAPIENIAVVDAVDPSGASLTDSDEADADVRAGGLAITGADATALLVLALLLIGGGTAALLLRRMRRRTV